MKKNVILVLIGMMLLLHGGMVTRADADENMDKEGRLTVPWDEFKALLNLDEDEIVISLETFQKLLAQAGIETTPADTLSEGNVVLKRAVFKKLVDQMKPHSEQGIQPPFDYLITKAFYSGTMDKDNTVFTGTFQVHVLKGGVYLKVPLLSQGVALKDIKVNGDQALVVSENGYHNVVLSGAGEYVVDASFSLKSSIEKGPHRIDLTIQKTPITLLKLEIPLKDIDVEVPQAQQVQTGLKDNTTTVSAIVAPGYNISVLWRKKVAIIEKIPPKLYCEIYHLISIEDDALKINSDVNYNILHSEVDGVRLSIPEDISVHAVSGEGVGEWQEIKQEDQRLINVPFTYGKKGAVTINITAEKTHPEKGITNAFSGIRALEAVRETGFIGIELNTSAEVKVAESEGLELVAVQKLPRPLFNKSVKPLILGCKYLKHPYSLALDIEKHEKIAMPVATINSASIVTLFTEDGKVVHRLIYNIRNSAKQFLEIRIPEKADVWSVFVGNEPVESSINALGKLLVPLIRSRSLDNRLDTFPVEVIYCLAESRFSLASSKESSLPSVDLLVSQLIWSVYLPSDYTYHYFRSTLEKEEMIRGLNIFAGSQRQYDEVAMKEVSNLIGTDSDRIQTDALKKIYKGKDYGSRFRNLPVEEGQITQQVNAELEFSGRLEGLAQQGEPQGNVSGYMTGTGVLPIQIEVPTGGQVYRFAKTIVKSDDRLTMSVVYTRKWLMKTVKWLLFLLILLIIYLNRRTVGKILHWLKDKLKVLGDFYGRHEHTIRKSAQSRVTLFMLFGMFIVFLFISRLFTLLFLFFFCVIALYQISLHREKKAQAKSKSANG